jgi:hypothetical protein
MNPLSLETLIHSSSRALVIGVGGGGDVVGALAASRVLLETLGENRIVFGSDYCGGLGALEKALPVIEEQTDPGRIKTITERNSRNLLRL